jgi:hypothetical protein
MSFDALMRWEWEGGTPASMRDGDEAAHTKPAKNTRMGSQATNGRDKARRATSVLPSPFERWHGDDSQR